MLVCSGTQKGHQEDLRRDCDFAQHAPVGCPEPNRQRSGSDKNHAEWFATITAGTRRERHRLRVQIADELSKFLSEKKLD